MNDLHSDPSIVATAISTESVEVAPGGAASTLFWMLPGPNAFLEHVAALLNRHRAIAIHLNERTVLGHQTFIERALSRTSFGVSEANDGSDWMLLRVHDASQIDCDIAQHLCATDGRRQIRAAALAEWHTVRARQRGDRLAPNVIVLRPRGAQAQQAAWSYINEFAQALAGPEGSAGNTRLVLLRVDDGSGWNDAALAGQSGQAELMQSGSQGASVAGSASPSSAARASFSGALGPDEMASYLGMRMAIADFVGSSSDVFGFPMKRLARALIAEFAGFDAHFAEGLMCMSDAELLDLPHSLGALANRMAVSDTVWRQTSPELGTLITIEGRTLVHTLHEWHLASNAGPYQALALKELDRKKWRAHLSALMPWFEELRHAIIKELRSLLSVHLAASSGEKVRELPRTGKVVRTKIDDLECNDINAMTREEPRVVGRNQRERAALDLCFKVSRVRNEIAHLRPPQAQDVQMLIESLSDLRRLRDSAA
jgi:hypothetical protein